MALKRAQHSAMIGWEYKGQDKLKHTSIAPELSQIIISIHILLALASMEASQFNLSLPTPGGTHRIKELVDHEG